MPSTRRFRPRRLARLPPIVWFPLATTCSCKHSPRFLPGEFYTASTRPPAVYRGNPFQIEVGLAFGGASTARKVSREVLDDLLAESDARTLRQFLIMTFNGMGPEGADKILKNVNLGTRQSPARLKTEGSRPVSSCLAKRPISTKVRRCKSCAMPIGYRCSFQHSACAITQAVINTNWRSYGLSQSRGSLPSGPVNVMVHMASVLGSLHQRIERSHCQLSGNTKRTSPGTSVGRPKTRDVPSPATACKTAGRNAAVFSLDISRKLPQRSVTSIVPTRIGYTTC